MSFPLRIGERLIPGPPALAQLVRADAATPGTVFEGQSPRDWVPALIDRKLLTLDLAVGLVAALLQDPSAPTLVECSHLARALGDPRLGDVLLSAVQAHDVGVLLLPGEDGHSVEDMLLIAAAQLSPATDAEVRGKLLEGLRHAGLPTAELAVLAKAGSAEEVRTWLPALLEEDLPDGTGIAALLTRSQTRESAIAVLLALEPPERRALWELARAADKTVAVDARLRTRLIGRFGVSAG